MDRGVDQFRFAAEDFFVPVPIVPRAELEAQEVGIRIRGVELVDRPRKYLPVVGKAVSVRVGQSAFDGMMKRIIDPLVFELVQDRSVTQIHSFESLDFDRPEDPDHHVLLHRLDRLVGIIGFLQAPRVDESGDALEELDRSGLLTQGRGIVDEKAIGFTK